MFIFSRRIRLTIIAFATAALSPLDICGENKPSPEAPPYEKILPPQGLEGELLGRWFADRALVCHHHHFKYGKYPDFENRTTFTEKVQYRMLYDRRPILTLFADKIKVRDYVAARVGEKYLTKIYQISSTPEEIDWQSLPPSYFAKTNHGSSMNIFVEWNGSEYPPNYIKNVKRILSQWLRTDYSDFCGEWCYREIPRLVYVEEDLGKENQRPIDWKFHLFDGKIYCFMVHKDTRCNFYDRNLQLLPVKQLQENFSEPFVFPENMEEMFDVVERLAEGIDFVRVDLYNINGRIVFGELTNYPHAGLVPFDPPEFDKQLGDQWKQERFN